MIINPYLVQPSGPAYGTLTTAWIAATGETDSTILGALNTLETDLTTYGLTSKMKALYPMVGGTSTKHSYNFMNTAAYQLTFSGGWTHSSTGALPNGTNGYADTTFVPSTQLSSINSMHLSYYSRNDPSFANRVEMGGLTGGVQAFLSYSWSVSQRYVALNNSGALTSPLINNFVGHLIDSRIASDRIRTFTSGTLTVDTAIVSTTWTSRNLYLGSVNYDGTASYFSNRECAFASIGEGLNTTEAANFYTAVQAFQTTLSRQV